MRRQCRQILPPLVVSTFLSPEGRQMAVFEDKRRFARVQEVSMAHGDDSRFARRRRCNAGGR